MPLESTIDGPASSPLDGLLLSLPKIERKHRQGVASLLTNGISPYYGLTSSERKSLPPVPHQHPHNTFPVPESSPHLTQGEHTVLRTAIALRFESARAREEMDTFLRTVDSEVEQWYRDTTGGSVPRQAELGSEGEARRRVEEEGRRREEIMKAAVAARVRLLREQLERRE